MAHKVTSEKKVDVPPRGLRNADPITDEPGAHPVEAGVGAAAVGAASGIAAGAVGGPVGAAIGAAVGAIAGGYAGKAVGEYIDPTTEDMWLRDNFASRPYVQKGDTFEKYVPAYRYGAKAECQYGGGQFDRIESDLERDWQSHHQEELVIPWENARPAVRDSYERTAEIRRARDVPEVTDEGLGE